ncbi:ELKS/Rab6-interacting/CAST family member 1-like [Pieris brassicae]|uniref:ELKS/Rab6-interacting/CAST family member 1-like n=1 Tax=Pieris brassicae TaxID=7116 RepID=UPI001E6620CD|nr:ELKS/Rab6-interacting/CAST family member 1-like [Pieris brassicae]
MKVIDLEIELNESSLILSEILNISDGQELSNIKKSTFLELQKSGKVLDRLDKCRFSRSHNDLLNVGENPQINAQKLTRKITDLTKEIEIKNSKIIEQQRSISILEKALRENNNIAEFEQLLAVIRSKDERIEELENILNKSGYTRKLYKDKRILKLEEALKESILIAAEREKVFYEEEKRRIEAITKMKKMEQRLKSLQNVSVMNCNTCSSILKRQKIMEETLHYCQKQRDAILRHLSNVIKDLLEEAVSAKDSEIAKLEIKGVLDENATNICESLKLERDRMLDRLKLENEKLMEFQKVTNITSEESSLPIISDDMTSEDNQLVWEEDIPATVL